MSRHLRRIERSRKANDLRAWDRYWQALDRTWYVLPDEPATITNLDADHAVAIERNRCLAIIDEHLAKLDRAHMPTEAFRVAILRKQIAEHDPSAPPATQKQG